MKTPMDVSARNLALAPVLTLILLLAGNASAATRFVNAANSAPTPPYLSWADAATTIQDAVGAATAGDTVLVTNGVYATGGKAVYWTMTNRVAINKAITVQSVNGPAVTLIVGQGAGGGTDYGDGAIRCVYVGTNAVLSGFTLTNGHTRSLGDSEETSGGGAWCEVNGVVSNCVLTGNSAIYSGGGSSGGTLNNCILTGNSANYGGGSDGGTLNNCALTGNSAIYSGGGSDRGTLNNCTLTGNSACDGGGSYYGTLNNCTLIGNSAANGGGSYYGTLNNCTLTGNSASYGGGSSDSTLHNCTVTGNSAWYGGGSHNGTLNNCIVYFNTALHGSNYYSSTFSYSCTAPLPSGGGNITGDPMLVSASHLSALSPCIGRGSASYTTGVDIDGELWQNPPCMGADQYVIGSVTGPLAMAIMASHTNVATGFAVDFTGQNQGRLMLSVWDFGDGTVVSNQPLIGHAWSSPGDYLVRFTGYNQNYPSGVSATLLVRVAVQDVYYVDAGSAAPAYPYTNWATAARTIQEAVDAGTQPGRLVLVTNGVYAADGKAVSRTMTNRVAISEDITVQSVNGPAVTLIVGQGSGGSTNCGDGAIRCAYVGTNAVLSGFTLTNGHTLASGDYETEMKGGGAWCEISGVISNCVLTGNSADKGGGSYSGTLNNCTLTGNSADQGGGSYSGTLNTCTLTGNSASQGGGSYKGTLNNCALTGNSSSYGGGGSDGGTLNNCTLTGNSAADHGGGSSWSTLTNCIVYFNTAPNDSNYYLSTVSYSCTAPLPPGTGNVTGDPLFVDRLGGDLRLLAGSPCIDAGDDSIVQPGWLDLDDLTRIVGAHVDMGAYEYQIVLPPNPPFAGLVWVTNTLAQGDGFSVSIPVQMENNRAYWLEMRTNLTEGNWQVVAGLTNNAGWTTLVDTNASDQQRFYRIGVK